MLLWWLVASGLLSSQNGVLAESQERPPGVFVRIHEKTVKYIAELASDGLPALLERVTLPTISTQMATVSPSITRFDRPDIQARFIPQKGVRVVMELPFVSILANMSISAIFVTYEEPIILNAEKGTIVMEIHFLRNTTSKTNDIQAAECTLVDPLLSIIFKEKSEMAWLEDTLKEKVLGALRTAVCETAIEAMRFVDHQQLQEDPLAPPPDDEDDEAFAAGLAANLCARERGEVEEEEEADNSLSSSLHTGPPWSLDLTMRQLPNFTERDVTFGVDGSVLLGHERAEDVPSPPILDHDLLGHKMIDILMTDYVPNTFFSHVFDYGLGQMDYKVAAESLPRSIRSVLRLVCPKCFIKVSALLIKKPRVEIDKILGARVAVSANVSVQFTSSKATHDVLNATTHMIVTMKPVIRQSRVYGDVSLTSMDVDVKEVAVSGAMAGPLEKILSFVVPRTLWPALKKRLRFALHQRGVQLPMLCGVHLESLSLSYTSRAILLDTNFTFDLPLFLRKFKAFANIRALEAGRPLLYDE